MLTLAYSLALLAFLLPNQALATYHRKLASPLTSFERVNKSLTKRHRSLIYETPGVIKLIHGNACGKMRPSNKENTIELTGEYQLPQYASEATIILNGFKLRFLDSEHHVRGLSAAIRHVTRDQQTLKWSTIGFISDKKQDAPFEFCYYYTLIAWNGQYLDAHASKKDDTVHNYNLFDKTTTALSILPNYYHLNKNQALSFVHIPRGFSLLFANQTKIFPACFDCPVDHHISQIAFSSSKAEAFIDPRKLYGSLPDPMLPSSEPYYGMGYLSWLDYAILKDDSLRRDYWADEWYSIIYGQSAKVIEPPFDILPVTKKRNLNIACTDEEPGMQVDNVIINHIPYDIAIPMLFGWQLNFSCGDEHIKEVGIWIDKIRYEQEDASSGKLHYKVFSILRNNDGTPGHIMKHNTHILGLNHG